MQTAQGLKRPKAHSRERLVVPTWEHDRYPTSYALGGKGCSLRRMTELGLNCPPAITVSTGLSRSFQETGALPSRLIAQLEKGILQMEERVGKCFGDPHNPLLVSVRSGAMVSMPGMMDTVLNVGLTTDVYAATAKAEGTPFADECLRHLKAGLGKEYGFVKRDAWAQLHAALRQVLISWNSDRAKAYRKKHQISDVLGTAITIQVMVFGHLRKEGQESGTGVAMSHNPETGEHELFGEYLSFAQGHDLVSGERTPESIDSLESRIPGTLTTLRDALALLEREDGEPIEVEFTVQSGVFYFLQYRRAKLSPQATVKHVVRKVWAKKVSKEDALAHIPKELIAQLRNRTRIDPTLDATTLRDQQIGNGLGVSSGAVTGYIARTEAEVAETKRHGYPYILVRKTTTPDDFTLMLGAAGIITEEGGTTSHAAVVARNMGIPAVIGIAADSFATVADVSDLMIRVTIDATHGIIYYGHLPLEGTVHGKEVNLFLKWVDREVSRVIKPSLCNELFSVNRLLNNFYLLEAAYAEAKDPMLQKKVATLRAEHTKHIADVFSVYLAVAVASELTHSHRIDQPARETWEAITKLRARYTLKHRYEGGTRVTHELASATSADVTEFFQLSKKVFQDKNWRSSFGGQAWAQIAEVGELYFARTITASVFVDRVFDLEHNNGSVFDKHPMVQSMSNLYDLKPMLNIKRKNLSVRAKYGELARHAPIDTEVMAVIKEFLK